MWSGPRPGGSGTSCVASRPLDRYAARVDPSVQSIIPVGYVADLDRSVAFYRLLGFAEQSSGADGDSRWCYLNSGDAYVLLADVRPALPTVEVPLTFYIYVNDLTAVLERLAAAGIDAERVGYPQHAAGGEARLTDPDGNTILAGQRTAGADQRERDANPAGQPDGTDRRFSLLQEAAAAIRRRGDAPAQCQIGEGGGRSCVNAAEVKLADGWGETAWACLAHADETLIGARGAFLANHDDQGLGLFLENRRRPV